MEVNSNLSEKAKLDLSLVNKALEGNQDAFKRLHERYYTSIYYLILKMVGNPSDAEDLTSEAISKAFRNIHQYVPNYAFSSWLFKIATNNAIDFIRMKKKNIIDYESAPYLQSEIKGSHITINDGDPNPEQKLIHSQGIERIWNIVNQLKPQYRLLIIMRYFEEFTYEEISVAMDIPMGTVKAQLYRARNMFQSLLRHGKKEI